jgi:hypothetical protein
MPGINRIVQRTNNEQRNIAQQQSIPNKEIYLRDGDQLFIQPWCTAKDDDESGYLQDYYMYTWNASVSGIARFANLLVHEDVDTSEVPDIDSYGNEIRPRKRFAFWGYVSEIIHKDITDRGREQGWEPVESAANGTRYREIVNDFRIISLGFGRGNVVFNQLKEAFNDMGGDLTKGVLRVTRIGAGLETSYNITCSMHPSVEAVPENPLPTILDYMKERYGKVYQGNTNENRILESNQSPVVTDAKNSLF